MTSADGYPIRRSRTGGSTAAATRWMPAYAGMTKESGWRWAFVLLLALAFKEFYSLAPAAALQWLLQPLALLLNASSLFDFRPTGTGEWLDAGHGLVIVKACAGGNFLIASWLGWLWRWRARPFGLAVLVRAFGAAWLTTLLANALRIALIAHGEAGLAEIAGIPAADSHRLIGIGVYFGSLALQLAGTRALLVAPVIYIGVAVVLPILNAVVRGNGDIGVAHLAATAALPLLTLAGYGLWRLPQRRPGRAAAHSIKVLRQVSDIACKHKPNFRPGEDSEQA